TTQTCVSPCGRTRSGLEKGYGKLRRHARRLPAPLPVVPAHLAAVAPHHSLRRLHPMPVILRDPALKGLQGWRRGVPVLPAPGGASARACWVCVTWLLAPGLELAALVSHAWVPWQRPTHRGALLGAVILRRGVSAVSTRHNLCDDLAFWSSCRS